MLDVFWCVLVCSGVFWCVLVWSWCDSCVFCGAFCIDLRDFILGTNPWSPGAVGPAELSF